MASARRRKYDGDHSLQFRILRFAIRLDPCYKLRRVTLHGTHTSDAAALDGAAARARYYWYWRFT